jgi:branched-chain amino acid transport system substrate-binding protein
MKKAIILLGLMAILCQPVLAAEPATIAAIFAKTGIAAEDNAPLFQGVSLAVEEINSHGGLLGRQLEVIELDNGQ